MIDFSRASKFEPTTIDGHEFSADRRLPPDLEQQELERWRQREKKRRNEKEEPAMIPLAAGLADVAIQVTTIIAANPNPKPRPNTDAKVCARCKGARFVRLNVPPNHPKFGRALRCSSCSNPWESYREKLESLWPVPSQILELGKTGIDLTGESKIDYLVDILGKIFEKWPTGVIIALDGYYGTAKSHSLAIIYRKAWEEKKGAIYLESAAQLESVFTQFERQENNLKLKTQAALQNFDAVAGEAFAAEENKLRLSRQRLIAELVAVPWLLIDEAQRYSRKGGNGWVERNLANLINARLLRGKTTVLAGNGMGDGRIIGRRGPNPLHPSILDRCTAADCLWVDLNGVSSGRSRYARQAGNWWE